MAHRGISERWLESEVQRLRGEVAMAHGNLAEADQRWRQAMTVAEEQHNRLAQLRIASSQLRLCRAYPPAADTAEALGRVYASFEEGLELAHKKMSGELDDARQNMLKEVDKHKLTAEKEAQRRLEVCRRMVKRMLDAHLAAAFNSLAQIVSDRIQRRAVVNRVLCRLRHGQLAAGFDRFSGVVFKALACRAQVARVISRLKSRAKLGAFLKWREYVDWCREELKREGIELAQKRLSGELETEKERMRAEMEQHKIDLYHGHR
jgi:hypothetical protein